MMIRQRDIKHSISISGNAVVLQWLLHEEDHGNPMICATLNLDEGPLPEHGAHDIGLSWEELIRMIEMNNEISDLVVMGEAYAGDVHCDADVGDVGSEIYVADVDCVVDEVSPSFVTPTYIVGEDVADVHDVEEVEDVHDVKDVGPLLAVLPPVHPHHNVPLLQVNPKYLYNLVTLFRAPWWIVFEICGQVFGTRECYFLGPRSQVDNMIPTMETFALDSVGHNKKERKRIDTIMEELQGIREKYVSEWILDPDNVQRNEVLQYLRLLY
ncbi:hypothetical protein V8G54_020469 [Vigna mungo]|uniref:Uncharacterized protein n=1 Tax=Vigna mungo TaxID=3915 RepID=A0AAQ3NEA9_VIGMU